MSSTDTLLTDVDRPSAQKVSVCELLLLSCSLVSLVLSCVLWSMHKQAWGDEIFTWREVNDPSLLHLYYAVRHGVDGGMPIFYATVWPWARAFGTADLTLRLYSCAAMCAAFLVTWKTIRRFYGIWATAFGVLTFWGTSDLLLEQNAEARFYGLFMLAVAIAVNIYMRLVVQPAPKLKLLVLSLLSQAGLVLTHVLGIIYGGLILLGLILSDGVKRRFRPRVYLFHAAGWMALLVWVPGIRTSMATGKPHGWIALPKIKDLFGTYFFLDSYQWFQLIGRHSHGSVSRIIQYAAEFAILLALAVIFLLGLRKLMAPRPRTSPDSKDALLVVAYLLLSAPVILFVVSYLITPIFVARYLLPSGIGLAIVLADFADAHGSDSQTSSRLVWGAVALFLAISPVLTALAMPPLHSSWRFLDVQRLDQTVPPNTAVVADWVDDFAKLMRYSHSPQTHYYFLLDWPTALTGPRASVPDYHLMSSYRDAGYFSQSIQDNEAFLCSHTGFFVLDTRLPGQDAEGPTWFEQTIRNMPQFEWKILDSFDGPGVKRKLISVHRREPLPFCNKP